MIPFRRILFPVDCSEPCQQAAPYVKEMAARFNAELIVMEAIDYPPLGFKDFYDSSEIPESALISPAEIRFREETKLREFVQANFAGVKLRSEIKVAETAKAIEDLVRSEGIDLVMMPTHGSGAFRRLLLGSVTGKVLHDASCAVWTDTHAVLGAHKPKLPYQSIICAVGFSGETGAILQGASAVAKAYGAKLHVVHSVEIPPATYEVDFGPYLPDLMEAAKVELQKRLAAAQVEATVHVGSGALGDVVRAEAAQCSADLLVTGRGHWQDRLAHVWSSLYSIVRESPCPVLSI
jgi:nucleotide-binding universal stress UspA family protein